MRHPRPNREYAPSSRLIEALPPRVRVPFISIDRAEDGALYTVVEVTLILNYICVLLIKTCDPSLVRSVTIDDQRVAEAVCSAYGLGDTASGESDHTKTRIMGNRGTLRSIAPIGPTREDCSLDLQVSTCSSCLSGSRCLLGC